VIEKGYIACEQSSRNWGWCRQTGRDSRELPLIRESLRLWAGLDEAVGGDTGFRQTGGHGAGKTATIPSAHRDSGSGGDLTVAAPSVSEVMPRSS
jgi:glycine/D-amino acid oxidase-like deaminating enzyme